MKWFLHVIGFLIATCNVAVAFNDDGAEDAVVYAEVVGAWTGSVGTGRYKLEIMNRMEPIVRVVWLKFKSNLDDVPQRFCQWQGDGVEIRYQSAIFDAVMEGDHILRKNVPHLEASLTSEGLVLRFNGKVHPDDKKSPLVLICSGRITKSSDCVCSVR